MIVHNVGYGTLFVILLLPTFITLVEAQRQGLEEEPPGEAELTALNGKKMLDIATSCLEKMEIEGVESTLGKECYALFESYNEHMKQLFHANKEAIDHILYG